MCVISLRIGIWKSDDSKISDYRRKWRKYCRFRARVGASQFLVGRRRLQRTYLGPNSTFQTNDMRRQQRFLIKQQY